MKSLKPFVFVLAGILITIALFSFKNEAPKKEYLIVRYYTGWVIIKPDLTEVKIEKGDYDKTLVKTINDLSNEGWLLVNVTSGASAGQSPYLYFERVKQ